MVGVVDSWNAAYFDNQLSAGVVAALAPLNEANADAQALADRAFRLMRVARLGPTDLSARTASILSGIRRAVPSAWGGAVPVSIAPWYALHDDNVENLCNAEAVGIIRSDRMRRYRRPAGAGCDQAHQAAVGRDPHRSSPRGSHASWRR
ncbi:MAG: hypothetical protein ACRDRG_19240 [Pseudonocardiaceae bacterium]